jgi:hypothetical protein
VKVRASSVWLSRASDFASDGKQNMVKIEEELNIDPQAKYMLYQVRSRVLPGWVLFIIN